MTAAICNHIVVCGWNDRAPGVVRSLRKLVSRTILIVHTDIQRPTREVGQLDDVFVILGDPTRPEVLEQADVRHARTVLVLADDALGLSSDARSVKLALLVERLQPEVYTVVEVRDIQNKAHFAWTMVDDLVTDQEIAVKMLAQGVRHALEQSEDEIARAGEGCRETSPEREAAVSLVGLYRQLVAPRRGAAELLRLDLAWKEYRDVPFARYLKAGLGFHILPVAFVGFRNVGGTTESRRLTGEIWKLDTLSNPPASLSAAALWKEWPRENAPLGLLVIAAAEADVAGFRGAVLEPKSTEGIL